MGGGLSVKDGLPVVEVLCKLLATRDIVEINSGRGKGGGGGAVGWGLQRHSRM